MKRVLVLLALSVGLIGRGAPRPELESESEKVNRALGGSENDVAAIERWLDTIQPVADHDKELQEHAEDVKERADEARGG